MGVALKASPAVMWYIKQRHPGCAALVDVITAAAPMVADAVEIRKAEVYALACVEDFVIYTTPAVMAETCDFIRGWSKERLFALADLTGKMVLDVGAGSCRLAFAAAEKAAWVSASEPVGTLRAFMREKIRTEGIQNVHVLDGFITDIPFPDDLFDVVISGHVIGDDWGGELAELTRVCKSGGYWLDCPGDSEQDMKPSAQLTARGWKEMHYLGSFGKDVYVHRKRIVK